MYKLENKPLYKNENREIFCGINSVNEKFLFKSISLNNDMTIYHFNNEISLFSNLSNTSLMQPLEIVDDNKLFLVYKKENYKNILDIDNLGFELIIDLFFMILKTVKVIHKRGFVHGNINPESIYVKNKSIKIINTGIYTKQLSSTEYLRSKTEYCSKEKHYNEILDFTSDIYSLGKLLLFFIMDNKTCKLQANTDEIMDVLIHRHYVSQSISLNLSNLITKMTETQTKNRISCIDDVLKEIKLLFEKEDELQLNKSIFIQERKFNFFVGRTIEINRIKRIIYKDSGIKIIGVKGDPGVGKTSLINHFFQKHNNLSNLHLELDCETLSEINIVSCFHYLLEQIIYNFPQIGNSSVLYKNFKNGSSGPLLPFVFKGGNNAFVNIDYNEAKQIIVELFKLDPLKEISPSLYIKNIHLLNLESRLVLLDLLSNIPLLKGLIIFEDKGGENWNPYENIYIKNFNYEEVREYLNQVFPLDTRQLLKFSQKCYNKTFGNPFYLKMFLLSLYEKGIMKIIKDKTIIDYNRADLVRVSDNVVEVIIRRINRLPNNLIDLLKIIYCIGEVLFLDYLFLFYKDKIQLIRDLKVLLDQEILYLIDGTISEFYWEQAIDSGIITSFIFSNVAVYESIKCLFEEDEEQKIYIEIIKKIKSKNHDLLCDILNPERLNIVIPYINDNEIKEFIINEIIEFAKKMQNSNNYNSSYNYIRTIMPIMDNSIDILNIYIESSYHTCRFDEVIKYSKIIIKNTNLLKDYEKAMRYCVYAYFSLGHYVEAWNLSIKYLNNYDIKINKSNINTKSMPLLYLNKIDKGIKNQQDSFNNIVPKSIFIDLAVSKFYLTYANNHKSILKQLFKFISFKYMSTDDSSILLLIAIYIYSQTKNIKNIKKIYKYSIKNSFNSLDSRTYVKDFLSGLIESSFSPLSHSIKKFKVAYRDSLLNKSFNWTMLSVLELRKYQLLNSYSIDTVISNLRSDISDKNLKKLKDLIDRLSTILEFCLTLKNEVIQNNIYGLFKRDDSFYLILQLIQSQLFNSKNYLLLAKEYFELNKQLYDPVSIFMSLYYYTDALLQKNVITHKDRIQIGINMRVLKKMVSSNTKNFNVKYRYLKGVCRVILKNNYKGFWDIEEAISESIKEAFYCDTGIFYEGMYKLSRNHNHNIIKNNLIIESYKAFKRWGAKKKCLKMKKDYPKVFIHYTEKNRYNITQNSAKDNNIVNKIQFMKKLRYEINFSARYETTFSMILLIFDNSEEDFKINRHQIISREITTNVRNIDVTTEYDKDKYLIILPRTNQKEGFIVVNKLKFRFENEKKFNNVRFEVIEYQQGLNSEEIIKRLVECSIEV